MRFTVQAPDGRKITLEGDRAPTEQDLNQVFGVQNIQSEQPQQYDPNILGKVGTIDRGLTFGLGRKGGGLLKAISYYPVDRAAEALGVENTPSFWDRYHEVVDPAMQAIEKYHEERPKEAFAVEMGASLLNPANKFGVGYIGKGGTLLNKALRSAGVGGVVGGVAGGMNTEETKDLFPNVAVGSTVGTTLGGALPVAANRAGWLYNSLKQIVSPEGSVAGKATGLQNIIKDNNSVRALKRGIMASDEVATQVLNEAPREMGRLNEQMADILDKTTGRKLNIEGAERNALEDYRNYIGRNADYPVYTETAPIKQKNPFELLVNDKEYKRVAKTEEADKGRSLLSFIVKRGGIKDVGGDLKAMDAGKQRIGIINNKSGESADDVALAAWENGYFPEKTERPTIQDLKDAINDEFFGKKRFPVQSEQDKTLINTVDQLAQEMDMLGVDYSNMTAKEAENAYNNAVSNWSRQNSEIPVNPFEEIAAPRKLGVPYIGDILGGLNDFKREALETALAKGAKMSDYAKGTLDSAHKAQEVLNDMINASYDTKNPLKPKATTETNQLMELKKVFNNMLEPSGVKPLDARISKAKSLQYFYDMGYKFKPSEKKFEDLGIKKLRDRQAFLQGRLKAITDNVKDDKNLAKAIKADENTLEKVMPKKNFAELMQNVNRINREYTRLNKFEQLADKSIDKPIAADRPMSEKSETKESFLGSLYDKAMARLWQDANTRRAQALLNGGAVNPTWAAILEEYGRQADISKLSPYLAQYLAENH